MDNVWQANVSGTAPTPVTPTAGYPTETGTPTIPGAYWFHTITQELLAVITGAGITPAYGVLNQVYAAITSLISTAISGLSSTYLSLTAAASTYLSQANAATTYAGLAAANVFTRQQAVTPYRANISGAVSIDLAATAHSNNLHLTLTGNVSSFALTNPVDGAVYNIRFIQDSTGSRTISLPSPFKFAGGTAPVFSTAASAVDFLSAEYGSSEATYMSAFSKGMA